MKILKSLIGILILVAIILPSAGAFQNIPTNYTNSTTGRLRGKIDAADTTGIQINADSFVTPIASGPVEWPTGNQFLKLSRRIGNKFQVEYIAADSASQVGSVVTLGTTKRSLSETGGTLFGSRGSGLDFPNGTVVEMVRTVQHEENTMYIVNKSTLTGSGQVTGSGVTLDQALINLPCITTTQRDAFDTTTEGDMICNSTVGSFQQRISNAWVNFGSGSNVNAGYATAGKSEGGTPTEIFDRTASGSTNAPLVPFVKDIIHGSGSAASQLATSNVVSTSGATIDPSLTGSGARDGTKFLRDDGVWAADRIGSGTNLIVNKLGTTQLANGASTTWAQIAADLVGEATVAVGDLLEFNLTIPYTEGGTTCSDLKVNFQMGAGTLPETSLGLGGATCTSAEQVMTVVYKHISQTGATMNFQPLYKVASNQVTMSCNGAPCIFQVTKIE